MKINDEKLDIGLRTLQKMDDFALYTEAAIVSRNNPTWPSAIEFERDMAIDTQSMKYDPLRAKQLAKVLILKNFLINK